jgi:L-threonylcarbamoyladenylate synthase
VRHLYAVKGRPADHPVIVHLADGASIGAWARDVPATAEALAGTFWPGPLTLLLKRRPDVDPTVSGGRDTVGLRVPAHPIAHELLRAFGGGVAAPSANRFGRVSPTTAEHVRADLGADVDLVLDGGASSVGVESTIVDLSGERPVLLRPGSISGDALAMVLGVDAIDGPAGPSRAPGMLTSHYAPRAAVEIVEDAGVAAARVEELRQAGRRAALLHPGPDAGAFAHDLYRWLRQADEQDIEVLVVVPPPPGGIGDAVRDRLRKAAAPRGESGAG